MKNKIFLKKSFIFYLCPFFSTFETRGLYFHSALDLTKDAVSTVQASRHAFLGKQKGPKVRGSLWHQTGVWPQYQQHHRHLGSC